jgi:hypothetical protein
MMEIGIEMQMMTVDRMSRRKMKMIAMTEEGAEVHGFLHRADRAAR